MPNEYDDNHVLLIIVYVTLISRLNRLDPELKLINTKPIIKNKLKESVS